MQKITTGKELYSKSEDEAGNMSMRGILKMIKMNSNQEALSEINLWIVNKTVLPLKMIRFCSNEAVKIRSEASLGNISDYSGEAINKAMSGATLANSSWYSGEAVIKAILGASASTALRLSVRP